MNRFYDMNRIAKFFIVCAAAFVLGLILVVIGITTGGKDGFHKVAEDHGWVKDGSTKICTVETKGEFDSVEATGPIDVVLVGGDYFNEAVKEYNLIEEENLGPGTVVIRYGNAYDAPEVTLDSGTLEITGIQDDNEPFVGIDFSDGESAWPVAIVFCDDKELKAVKVSSEYADVEMMGIAFADADIELNDGDVDLANIRSKGLKISSDYGDVEVAGDLRGETEVTLESGDIEIDTLAKLKEYTIKAGSDDGDIKVGKKELEFPFDEGGDYQEEGYQYIQEGGKDTLIVKTTYGDIEISTMKAPETVEL